MGSYSQFIFISWLDYSAASGWWSVRVQLMDNICRREWKRRPSPPAGGLTTNHCLVQLSAAAQIKKQRSKPGRSLLQLQMCIFRETETRRDFQRKYLKSKRLTTKIALPYLICFHKNILHTPTPARFLPPLGWNSRSWYGNKKRTRGIFWFRAAPFS